MTPIYERTVIGTWLVGFMMIMAALMFAVVFMAEDADKALWTPVLILVVPLLLGVMRLSVTPRELRVRFWLGLPRRTVPIADIDTYRVTRSRMETGFGVSVKPMQGHYCMSGPGAVNILLKNGRNLMIGTPEPEKLVKALDRARKRSGLEE